LRSPEKGEVKLRKSEIDILIADDHPIVRQGLRQVLAAEADLRIVGEAEDGETALRMMKESKPDIAILDLNMPKMSGFEVARIIRQKELPVAIIFLTIYSDQEMFNKALNLGAKGYVLKDSAVSDIVSSIRAITLGQCFTSPSVTTHLFNRAAKAASAMDKPMGLASLTPAEMRVLRLIAEYKTNKEIADELCIHYRTVENHRNNICSKLNVHGSHSLLKFALKHSAEIG
jgi:DNA-binding NarL/FixJ family response regulator